MTQLTSGNLLRRARISRCKVKTATLALFVSTAALAQIYPPPGGYPGGSPYPGRRTPTGTGIPSPGRTSKQPDKNKTTEPMPSFRGILRQMDDKSLSVELGDNRV